MSKFTQVLHLPSTSEGSVVAQSIKAVIAKNISAPKLSTVADEDGMLEHLINYSTHLLFY